MTNSPRESTCHGIRRVLIVGGSTRAAAWSAVRAGLQPICADLFADVDLPQTAQVISVRAFPDSLPQDVAEVRADGWMYTGALENRPDLIERLDRPDAPYGRLWGTHASALKLIRDPLWIAELLRESGFESLPIQRETAPPPDGTWMLKPISSAGGRAVCVWDLERANRPIDEPTYFQKRVDGDSMSALFTRDRDVEFVGFMRQGMTHEISGAISPYLYSGTLGLVQPDGFADLKELLTRQAATLAAGSGLRGTFGIDFIRDRHGHPWILEVNPRYTASVEVAELALGRSFLRFPGVAATNPVRDTPAHRIVAKTILYARQSFPAPDLTGLIETQSPWQIPFIADVPQPGSLIQAGWPICTVFSVGDTVFAAGNEVNDCLDQLCRRVKALWQRIGDPSVSPVATDTCVLDRLGDRR